MTVAPPCCTRLRHGEVGFSFVCSPESCTVPPLLPSCGPLQNISSKLSPTFVSFCLHGSHPGKHHVGEVVCPPLHPHRGAIWSTGDYKGLFCVSAPPCGLPPHGEGVGNDSRDFDVFCLCIWNRTHVKCHLVLSSSDVSGSVRGTTALTDSAGAEGQ